MSTWLIVTNVFFLVITAPNCLQPLCESTHILRILKNSDFKQDSWHIISFTNDTKQSKVTNYSRLSHRVEALKQMELVQMGKLQDRSPGDLHLLLASGIKLTPYFMASHPPPRPTSTWPPSQVYSSIEFSGGSNCLESWHPNMLHDWTWPRSTHGGLRLCEDVTERSRPLLGNWTNQESILRGVHQKPSWTNAKSQCMVFCLPLKWKRWQLLQQWSTKCTSSKVTKVIPAAGPTTLVYFDRVQQTTTSTRTAQG